MTVASLTAFAGDQAALGGHGTTLAAAHELRAVLGVPLYLTAIAALAAGLGFLLRSTAAGVATLICLILVLPLTVAFLPGSWSATISPYLPSNAGAAVYAVHPDPAGLGPWAGLAVLCGCAAVTLTAAAILLRRRDA